MRGRFVQSEKIEDIAGLKRVDDVRVGEQMVLLTSEIALKWPEPDLDVPSALDLLILESLLVLDAYRVSTRVNKPTTGEASLIDPI